ncbi:hypothetical protein N7456_007031 [Penicillium angulare]|uniref:Protein kinase domain-containing protein n=1 Tax=Penicillium angulare TaxID=116970 RepID=A0A9W9KC85_9EURO|nr:hypothetical protein N7456_006903 [Penicillium angulare]KAJ5100979.1 hypothetical protein N7456_007031 [Penicillium angulare]
MSSLARQTIWVDASDQSLDPRSMTTLVSNAARQPEVPGPRPMVKICDQDPGDYFDSIAEIIFDRPLCIARQKQAKGELVHIQKLECATLARNILKDFNDQTTHRSFRQLLGGYRHGGMAFLLWEPVEVSVEQIMAAQGIIKATEVIAIAKPVLEGIRHLADHGRVLNVLNAKTILLTATGQVKIAGIENSIQIDPEAMDAATMKLSALAHVISGLIKKNPASYEWSPMIKNLLLQLETRSANEILQTTPFNPGPPIDELVMMTNITNKTAHHRVKYSDRGED